MKKNFSYLLLSTFLIFIAHYADAETIATYQVSENYVANFGTPEANPEGFGTGVATLDSSGVLTLDMSGTNFGSQFFHYSATETFSGIIENGTFFISGGSDIFCPEMSDCSSLQLIPNLNAGSSGGCCGMHYFAALITNANDTSAGTAFFYDFYEPKGNYLAITNVPTPSAAILFLSSLVGIIGGCVRRSIQRR